VNFYKHFLGDYARDTQSLSLIEHGAYRVLLDHCYATELPLPTDRLELFRIAKAMTAAERKAVDRMAERFFPSGINKRCAAEIASAHAYADAQAMRSQIRWDKQRQCPDDASHSHSQKNLKPSRTPRPELNGTFVQFWSAYPKKEAKGRAEKAWIKINPDESLTGMIVAAVERAKSSEKWSEDGGRYIPLPATFLNDRRWEDQGVSLPAEVRGAVV